ncbi:MAG: hypothetical protein EBZ47_02470 [Chlamydiae bacterium]|nr:hypothetical protein [Chlamydiota bacterium]
MTITSNPPATEQFNLCKLTEDSFKEIISYLGLKDIQAVVSVNRFLQRVGISSAFLCEKTAFQNFIKNPIQYFIRRDIFPEEKEILEHISLDISNPDFLPRSLKEVKRFLIDFKLETSHALAKVDQSTAGQAVNVAPSGNFLRDIDKYTYLQRRLAQVLMVPDERNEAKLQDILYEACSLKLFDLALEIAKFGDESYRNRSFLPKIAVAVAESGDLHEGLRIAGLITDEHQYQRTLEDLIPAIAKFDLEKAISLIQSIPCTEKKNSILGQIAVNVAESGDLNQAYGMATSMNIELGKTLELLLFLCGKFAESGDFNRAEDIAFSIPNTYIRQYAFEAIAKMHLKL